jgi:hypothetical protein
MIYDTRGLLWHNILDEQHRMMYGENSIRRVNGIFRDGKFIKGVVIEDDFIGD